MKRFIQNYLINDDGTIDQQFKPVKIYPNHDGFLMVKSPGFDKKPIHRLMALAFVDNPNNLKYVKHLDGNKLNNHPNNLKWSDAPIKGKQKQKQCFYHGQTYPSIQILTKVVFNGYLNPKKRKQLELSGELIIGEYQQNE